MKEEICAVPYGTPPIISADKVEEFLNMKPNKELEKQIKERLEKCNITVIDNTCSKQCDKVDKLKSTIKELRKENRKLKKEITEMLKYAWYKEGENNVD